MKITMYELLGMVIDGKAPKKIKFDSIEWEYTGHQYRRLDKENLGNIWNGCNFNILNYEVVILEEEKKIPEKLFYREYYATQNACIDDIIRQFNNLIDYLKSKGDE